jgi:hypothetical protein
MASTSEPSCSAFQDLLVFFRFDKSKLKLSALFESREAYFTPRNATFVPGLPLSRRPDHLIMPTRSEVLHQPEWFDGTPIKEESETEGLGLRYTKWFPTAARRGPHLNAPWRKTEAMIAEGSAEGASSSEQTAPARQIPQDKEERLSNQKKRPHEAAEAELAKNRVQRSGLP